jgi:heme/copper-type cytochrome/quinol oxidase subunit 2
MRNCKLHSIFFKMLTFFVIWLIGYFASYFIWRYGCRKLDGSYTKGDRVKNIFRSLLSWIIVVICTILILIESTDYDEQAKW